MSAVIGCMEPAPAASWELLGCCWMTRSVSAVWQKPDAIAAIELTAAVANAGPMSDPVSNQLSGSMPSIHASFRTSLPTDEIPSTSATVRPASASAAWLAWITSSSMESPVVRPIVE